MRDTIGVGETPGDKPRFLRNAYALLLNTGIAGCLGLLYWFLAARHYPDPDVGRGSAAISALMLLTGLVSNNTAGTLNRFLPRTGRRTLVVVAWIYLITSAVLALMAAGFVIALRWWGGPALDLLREPTVRLWFIAAAVVAGLMNVQDSVMTGLRAAPWVPVCNAVFGVAKIIVLLLLAPSLPRYGVFLSWIIPLAVVVVPANLLIFGWLLPRHMRLPAHQPPTRGQVGRFFAADYVGALFLFATTFLLPVVVATRVEPHTYAYFFLAWSIAIIMNLIPVNIATSMAVEGVYDTSTLARNCRSALGQALGLLLCATVTLSLAAPYALGLLGAGYLDAAPLLQLLAFASLPTAVIEIFLGTLRARTQRLAIIAVQSARGITVLGLVIYFLNHQQWFTGFGDPRLTAVGVAVLLGQLTVVVAISPALARLLGLRQRTAAADLATVAVAAEMTGASR